MHDREVIVWYIVGIDGRTAKHIEISLVPGPDVVTETAKGI